jgi:ubiquinone/menaquinone biosynthesis C-methylase UbiE
MADRDRPHADEPAARTTLQDYWDRVGHTYAGEDPLAAVCYPGAPVWLNRFIATLQWRTVTGCLARLPVDGAVALDVGCGFGRWTRWLADHGARVIGVDATDGMLQAARAGAPGIDFRQMSATALTFPAASVDLAVCITVIQHLQPAEQLLAIGELCRVVRPGGHVVVLDLIDPFDRGQVVHPRPPHEWIACYGQHGAELVGWRGQEYVPVLRAFRWLAERAARLTGLGTSPQAAGASLLERTNRGGIFRLAYGGLWGVVQLSRLLEPLCERLLPDRWARHGCFVFRKPGNAAAR